jgi:hypothetical protein
MVLYYRGKLLDNEAQLSQYNIGQGRQKL